MITLCVHFLTCEEYYLLGYNAVSEEYFATIFSVEEYAKQQTSVKAGGKQSYMLHADFLLGLFFDTEDGGQIFLRNVGWLSTDYRALYPRK
jgi:hypothetical protein